MKFYDFLISGSNVFAMRIFMFFTDVKRIRFLVWKRTKTDNSDYTITLTKPLKLMLAEIA